MSDPASVRVVVLCCDGPYQRHLVHRAAACFDLVGVVVQHSPLARGSLGSRLRRYLHPRSLLRYVEARFLLPRHERRAERLRARLFPGADRSPPLPGGVHVLTTQSINGEDVVAFLRERRADLVLVNGTQLLREPVLSLIPSIRYGIVNLHTGLSPYSRGGNCNLYMILEGHPELVGVTVHHIDQGIDSGDIILSAQVPLQPDDNFETLDMRSFAVGIELLLRGARLLVEGRAPRVPQWEKGKLFLRRTGYRYEPWQRLKANRLIEAGLGRDYLRRRHELDRHVRLVEEHPAGPA